MARGTYSSENNTSANWEELYQAIWVNAINQDMAEVKRSIGAKAFTVAYSLYQSKAKEPLSTDDKRFRSFKKDIRKFLNLKIESVEERVRELVYQEMLEWPENKYLKLEDERYKKAVKELEEETKEFAIERMENRWYKI